MRKKEENTEKGTARKEAEAFLLLAVSKRKAYGAISKKGGNLRMAS